jgi:hypothetical protein
VGVVRSWIFFIKSTEFGTCTPSPNPSRLCGRGIIHTCPKVPLRFTLGCGYYVPPALKYGFLARTEISPYIARALMGTLGEIMKYEL